MRNHIRIRAAILEELGKPLVVGDIEATQLLPGQVLVKVLFSGLCRSQLMEARGGRGLDPWVPHLLGHEGSGIVVAIGQGVTKVGPGDEVILGWLRGQGIEAPGAKYLRGNQVINSGCVTTLSNYTIVSENRIVIKPAALPSDSAVLFGCALPTGAGMVFNELKPSLNSSVIVLGLGGIGIAALMALKALKINKVIAIDIAEDKLSFARQLGVVHAFNSKNPNLNKEILQITGGGADICIESGGHVETIELGFSLIRKHGGKLLFASHPPDGDLIKLSPHDLISGKAIAGSWGGSTCPDADIPKMHEHFRSADIALGGLLTKRYSLDQINDALDDLENGKVFRPLIQMQHLD